MTLREMLAVIFARRRLVLQVFGTIVVLVLLLSLLLPKTYRAEVSMVVDAKATDPVSGLMLPPQLMPSNIATQIDVIGSRSVALKVIDRFRLHEYPDVQEQFQDAGGSGSIREWLVDSLHRNLRVKPSRESNVIRIAYSAANAEFAAAIANEFADAYIQTSLELKMDPARRQTSWFDSQIAGLRKTLLAAQDTLSKYQQSQNIVGGDERLDIENARLAEIASQLVAAQAAMYDAQTRQRQVSDAVKSNRLGELPDILNNGLLQSMKADLTRAESKLAEAGSRYARRHPLYLSAEAEVRALRSRIDKELKTAQGSIGQAAQLAERRAAAVQSALETQKQRILELQQQRDAMSVMIRDVQGAQRAYDAAMQRADQVRLEGQLDQSTVAVIDRASPPAKPASPLLVLNLAIAILVGAMLGVAAALSSELMNRRVHSAADIVGRTGLIILAEIPRTPAPKLIERWRRLALPSPQPSAT